MNKYLYRGVSVFDDEKNKGELTPKGELSSTVPHLGQQGLKLGAGYVIGASEGNAVRAHQVDSGMGGGCYISVTKSKDIALKFATSGKIEEGYIYTLDPSLFAEYGVETYEIPNPVNSDECEVTIRAKDNGSIPKEVIICKENVTP
jgi:hypothetical protein|tara:strand:+ start:404 stop:841 length:438 start_codon:yes stop_codon:yes gene_type:complete